MIRLWHSHDQEQNEPAYTAPARGAGPGIEVKRAGIDLLIAKGWLDANAEHDARQVRAALVKMVNKVLTAPEPEPQPEPSPRRFKQALQAVKVLNFGLF
jgi:hypothetical protein